MGEKTPIETFITVDVGERNAHSCSRSLHAKARKLHDYIYKLPFNNYTEGLVSYCNCYLIYITSHNSFAPFSPQYTFL